MHGCPLYSLHRQAALLSKMYAGLYIVCKPLVEQDHLLMTAKFLLYLQPSFSLPTSGLADHIKLNETSPQSDASREKTAGI